MSVHSTRCMVRLLIFSSLLSRSYMHVYPSFKMKLSRLYNIYYTE